jgi:hypothetical protein
VGTVPNGFEVKAMVRCTVEEQFVRGNPQTKFTVTRQLALITDGVTGLLDVPDSPPPVPPAACNLAAAVKPYLLLVDTSTIQKSTKAVRVRVPDDGCGNGQERILVALDAAVWTTLDVRTVVVDNE